MAESRTYIRISKARYEAIPIAQAFLDKRGPFFRDDGEEMTQENTVVKEAVEAWGRNRVANLLDLEDGSVPERVEYEDATHLVVGIPNVSQREIQALLQTAEILGFSDLPVLFAHDEIRHYLETGEMPQA